MFKTMQLVYRNMVWNRPKIGLWGLIVVALVATTDLYFSILRIGGGRVTAGVFAAFALSFWFVGLPMVLTLIDLKMKPQRMEKIWAQMHKQ
jgi:hypothetical protein